MLVYAKQYLQPTTIRVIDDKFGTVDFSQIRASDLAANGRLKPVAARHFAEKAERIQTINQFVSSPAYADPAINVHFSGLRMAQMFNDELDLDQWDIVQPYVRLSEQAEAEQNSNALMENTMSAIDSPAGLTPEDYSVPA